MNVYEVPLLTYAKHHTYILGPVSGERWSPGYIDVLKSCSKINEPRSEKTGLRGFRPGPTQTGLYNY